MLLWIENHPGLAAWIQAIFSIIAIGALILSNRMQHNSALKVSENELKTAQEVLLGAVSSIGQAAYRVMDNIRREIDSYVSLMAVAEGEKYLYRGGLNDQERNLKAIPLHEIPSPQMVVHVIQQVAYINQFNNSITKVLNEYREMDAQALDQFFHDLKAMVSHAEDTSNKMKAILEAHNSKP